jgi:hypothetical protein
MHAYFAGRESLHKFIPGNISIQITFARAYNLLKSDLFDVYSVLAVKSAARHDQQAVQNPRHYPENEVFIEGFQHRVLCNIKTAMEIK